MGALLAFAAIVIAVQYGRLGGPAPPIVPPGAPPEGVQLVYARNPANAHGLVAYDWSGNRRGVITFPTWVDIGRLRPAPNGSGFMLDPASQDDYAAYFDRYAHTVFETNEQSFVSQAWADDSTHVCVYTSEGDLLTRDPGRPDRVAHARLVDQFSVVACSLRSDLAVLASSDRIEVVRLSTGESLRGAGIAFSGPVVASTDGRFFVVTGGGGAKDIFATSNLSTPVGHLDAAVNPLAFSSDDALLLAGQESGSGPLEAVAWRSGSVAWRYGAGTAGVELVVARPSAPDFAIYVGAELVIVHRDGKSVQIG